MASHPICSRCCQTICGGDYDTEEADFGATWVEETLASRGFLFRLFHRIATASSVPCSANQGSTSVRERLCVQDLCTSITPHSWIPNNTLASSGPRADARLPCSSYGLPPSPQRRISACNFQLLVSYLTVGLSQSHNSSSRLQPNLIAIYAFLDVFLHQQKTSIQLPKSPSTHVLLESRIGSRGNRTAKAPASLLIQCREPCKFYPTSFPGTSRPRVQLARPPTLQTLMM